jgi:hypothetical protein
MEISNYRYIKHLLLPADWQEAPSEETSIGFRTVRSFHPPDLDDVRMEIFYRGLPMHEKSSISFRKLLETAPRPVYDRGKTAKPTEVDITLFKDLRELLGNAGNNQLVNPKTDYLGPTFIVERFDTLLWNGKNILALRGWFRNPETDVRVYDFCGFFIDGNPSEPECQVEEIFLEAADQELYARYLPDFEESLKSIEWM